MDTAGHDDQATTDDLPFLGPYRLFSVIHQDGLTTTYRAEDPHRRRVLITSAGLRSYGPALAQRLRAEMVKLWRVPSSCAPRLLDAQLDQDPPYLVREFVDGPSLAQSVQLGRTFTAEAVRGFAEELATLLRFLHSMDVVHGGLTPDRLMLGSEGLRLIGFTTERDVEAVDADRPAFTAPEALSAAPGTLPDPAEDVFGWGCLVVYALTGRSPFEGDHAAVVISKLLDGRADLDGVPEQLRPIIGRALAPDPADRPSTAQLIDALKTGGNSPVAAPRAGRTPSASLAEDDQFPRFVAVDHGSGAGTRSPERPRATRRRWIAVVGAVLLAVGGLALAREDVLTSPSAVVPTAPPGGGSAPSVEPAPQSPGATAAATPVEPTGGEIITKDSLDRRGAWSDSTLTGGAGICAVRDGLNVTMTRAGSLRCLGPTEELTDDIGIEVFAALHTAGTCAVVWFHAEPADGPGTALQLCEKRIVVAADPAGDAPHGILILRKPVAIGKPVRLHLLLKDRKVTVWRDGAYVGVVPLPATESDTGQILLGITGTGTTGPHRATFTDVDIRSH